MGFAVRVRVRVRVGVAVGVRVAVRAAVGVRDRRAPLHTCAGRRTTRTAR